MTEAELERRVAALPSLSSAELREQWTRLTGTPAPRVSPSLMRLALAWELQAEVHGGLSRTTQQKLEQIAAAKTRTSVAAPGTRLVREWNGQAHVVTIEEGNVIRWRERDYRSLSEVARAITGTGAVSLTRTRLW